MLSLIKKLLKENRCNLTFKLYIIAKHCLVKHYQFMSILQHPRMIQNLNVNSKSQYLPNQVLVIIYICFNRLQNLNPKIRYSFNNYQVDYLMIKVRLCVQVQLQFNQIEKRLQNNHLCTLILENKINEKKFGIIYAVLYNNIEYVKLI